MSYFGNNDWLVEVARGNVPGAALVHKFGAGTIGTTLVPISFSTAYPTPTTATALEFVSSDDEDGGAGTDTGALEVTVQGLNSSWAEVSQTVTTNGTTAVALGTNLIRLYRWYVSSSGTYATAAAGSHQGILTIREAGAGATWFTIPITPFPMGQSQIGAYTVPTGKTAYILSWGTTSDSTKTLTAILFQRPLADDVTTPFNGAMRAIAYKSGIVSGFESTPHSPWGPFVGPCDIGVLGKISATTSAVSTDFEMLILDN